VTLWKRILQRHRQRRLQQQLLALAAQGQRQARLLRLCGKLTMQSLPGIPAELQTPAASSQVSRLGMLAVAKMWSRLNRRHQDNLIRLVFRQALSRLLHRH